MTDEQIKQNAERYAKLENCKGIDYPKYLGYIAGAHSRDEEIGRMNTTIRLYANQIAQLRKEIEQLRNPWISVEERLPTNQKQKVIMRKKTGQCYYGWFDTSLNCFMTITPDCTKWTINGVTHWMPIQELKKGDKQ